MFGRVTITLGIGYILVSFDLFSNRITCASCMFSATDRFVQHFV